MKIRTISGIEDIERVSHLSALTFHNNYEESYQWYKDRFLHCPYIRKDFCWVAEVDEEIVSRVQIIDYKMHIGSSIVRMGGLAAVLTEPSHRGNGYAKMALERSIEFMDESGFDVSVLFGIGDFYEKVGYIPAIPDYEVSIDVSDIKCEGVDGFKEMKEEDLDKVLEFYHSSNENRTGAILRPKDAWKWMHRKPPLFLIRKDGYIGVDFDDEAVELYDIAGVNNQFYNKAVLKLGSMARERDLEEIKAFLPPDHPFASMAIKYGSKVEVFYSRTGNCMARIIDICSLFDKIRPELENRVKKSEFSEIAVDLTIQSDVGDIKMTLNKTCSKNIALSLDLPHTAITQLVMGYRPAQMILSENDIFLDEIPLKMFETLFSWGYPFIWRSDHF